MKKTIVVKQIKLCYNKIMNKIYNNLNIENLMRTEWVKQFNKE